MIRVSNSLDPDLLAMIIPKGYQHATIKSLVTTVLSAKSDRDNEFCFQSYQGIMID